MRETHTYCFYLNGKIKHRIVVPVMTYKASKVFMKTFHESKMFVKHNAASDYYTVVETEIEQDVIDRYDLIIVGRMHDNSIYFGLSKSEEENYISKFHHYSNDETAVERKCSSSNISTQMGSGKSKLLAQHQKVNSDEKALRILMRVPKVKE